MTVQANSFFPLREHLLGKMYNIAPVSYRCAWVVALLLLPVITLAAAYDPLVADAAMRGDAEAVRILLRDGADANAAQGDGMTALHWAATNDNPVIASMLVYAGANAQATTRLGRYTPLHLAAKAGSAAVVSILLEARATASAVTSTGGAQAIHFAAAAGVAESVEMLLKYGADVDAREQTRQQTPLMFAGAFNRTEVIKALLAGGADVTLTAEVINISEREASDRADQRGDAPPASSAQQRYTENEEEPLSYADLVGHHGGLTALLHAVREGHVESAMVLLEAGADLNQPSAGDHTPPMLMAMLNGHFDLALSLLILGADPTLASDAGTTPLYAALNVHWAPKSRYPQQHVYRQQRASYMDVMLAMLEAGADPNARLTKHLWYMSYNFDLLRVDTKGATPFWRAAYALDVPAMRLLVAYGADPALATEKPPQRFRREQDRDMDPSGLPLVPVRGPAVYPIHAASGAGYGQGFAANAHRYAPDGWLPTVRYLVEEAGADVNSRDVDGYTAVHHAAARGDNELILYLVEHGADVTAVNRRGQTTADMANGPVQRIQPFPETLALLVGLGAINNGNCVSC